MTRSINTEKLADIQSIVAKLERLPKSTRMYVVGYVEGAADTSEQGQSGEGAEQDSA